MSTSAERTFVVPQENRLVFVSKTSSRYDRTIKILQEDRIVFVERQPTSAERVVYATED